MKITIIEANMTGLQHSPINSAMCRIFSELSENEKINLYCSNEHYEALNLNTKKIVHHSVAVLQPGKQRVKKIFLEYSQCKKIIEHSDADLYVLLSSFPNAQFFITKYASKNRHKRILTITHGEAEGLEMAGKWKFWSYPFWITACSKLNQPDNYVRIVLGNSIKTNIEKYFNGRIFSVEHPIGQCYEKNYSLPQLKSNIFGYIGNCLYKKGGNTFIDASRSCSESKSEFWIIGAYDLKDDTKASPQQLKILSEKHKMLDHKTFNEAISKITYACFPYPSDTYKFTASGAVLDAIRFLKPIVYIKNDYFNGIFKDAGNIGYACENEDEFVETIKYIDKHPDFNTYSEQVNNLKSLQSKFSIEGVKKQMLDVVSKLLEKDNVMV